jgi:TonB family protein
MKTRLIVLTVLVCLVGCSSLADPSPTETVKKFMEAAKEGDAETMTNLFSQRAIKRDGIEKTRENNRVLASLNQKAKGRDYQMKNIKESTDGTNARVAFHYQTADKIDSLRMVFALSKEDGTWKVDNIGGAELEAIADLASSELKDPKVRKTPAGDAPPTPTSPSETAPQPMPAMPGNAMAGGVLNEKAISLPQPLYPSVARAAHAGGKVVVQVLVDEKGNVTDAVAIVGHPMLRAPAVAAARAAKFPPAKDAGQPVKVKGVIHYNFEAQ